MSRCFEKNCYLSNIQDFYKIEQIDRIPECVISPVAHYLPFHSFLFPLYSALLGIHGAVPALQYCLIKEIDYVYCVKDEKLNKLG